jgi:hypothetical protein
VQKLITLFITLCLAAPAYAQKPRDISESSVRSHMEFLASDALNGRGSGTRDEWIAATYIASQLRRWGIEPLGDAGGYVQDVRIERTEVAAPPTLTFAGGSLTHGKEMFVAGLGAARITGALQKVKAGGAPADIAGAAILLPEGAPTSLQSPGGPPALVIALETEAQRTRRQAGAARPLTLPPRILGIPAAPAPARATMITVDQATYTTLAALAEGTVLTLQADVKPAQLAHTWNAIGKLKGTAANADDQVILLTAHLDHLGNRAPATPPAADAPPSDTIFNGADDDASGSVAVLELAEQLAKGKRPKRTVIFAWFGSEESGGFGARHFIDAPPVPLGRIVANLEFEMIGRADKAVPPHTLWLTGYERSNLGPELARRGAKIVADPHPDQNFFQRSDNIQLARRGVIAQTVSSFGLHTDYHRASDEVKTMDFPHMTDSIRSMLKPVRWLANSKFRPEWRPGQKP